LQVRGIYCSEQSECGEIAVINRIKIIFAAPFSHKGFFFSSTFSKIKFFGQTLSFKDHLKEITMRKDCPKHVAQELVDQIFLDVQHFSEKVPRAADLQKLDTIERKREPLR
jgi:hypothetical protein